MCFSFLTTKKMEDDSGLNISDNAATYGGESAFTQLEHNIVAGYLITAGNIHKTNNCLKRVSFTENVINK